jgi:hypothetical protein
LFALILFAYTAEILVVFAGDIIASETKYLNEDISLGNTFLKNGTGIATAEKEGFSIIGVIGNDIGLLRSPLEPIS